MFDHGDKWAAKPKARAIKMRWVLKCEPNFLVFVSKLKPAQRGKSSYS